MSTQNTTTTKIEKAGDFAVEFFHLLGLFVIGATIVWTAIHEYLIIMQNGGYATLKDILLLFIYLELGAMVGIYFKTHQLPVQFLLYIAITALTRFIAIDVKSMSEAMIGTITGAILVLCLSIMALKFSNKLSSDQDDKVR